MQSRSLFREPAQARRLLLTLVLTAAAAAVTARVALEEHRPDSAAAAVGLGVAPTSAAKAPVQDDQPVLLFDPELGYMTVEPVVPAAPAATPAPAKAANRSAPTF